VARHSGASRAEVTLRIQPGTLLIEIRDDGRGGATSTRGLRGLTDRVEANAGTLTIDNGRHGTPAERRKLSGT
jgi:signal transduction histidine kinase